MARPPELHGPALDARRYGEAPGWLMNGSGCVVALPSDWKARVLELADRACLEGSSCKILAQAWNQAKLATVLKLVLCVAPGDLRQELALRTSECKGDAVENRSFQGNIRKTRFGKLPFCLPLLGQQKCNASHRQRSTIWPMVERCTEGNPTAKHVVEVMLDGDEQTLRQQASPVLLKCCRYATRCRSPRSDSFSVWTDVLEVFAD